MKFTTALITSALALAHGSSAHYIFTTFTGGGKTTSANIRMPATNSPIRNIELPEATCNSNAIATETIEVAAGSEITFTPDNTLFHPGTGAIYLGQAPSGTPAATWDGKDKSWFKIAEWGATFSPFKFILQDAKSMSATIPADIPAGEYLARVEHIAFHIGGSHELYVSCAQIKVTGGGSANPARVSIPGYASASDSKLTTNMHYPEPTAWGIVGPEVYKSGGSTTPPTTPEVPEVPEVPETPAPEVPETPAPEVPETPEPEVPEVPSPSPSSAPAPPKPTTEAPKPTTPVPQPTVPAPQPTGGVKDANACMNEFNQCIAKSQPKPDWEGCGATRDTCLSTATYNSNMLARAKRSGRYGRMLL